jgi:hypothetical protein
LYVALVLVLMPISASRAAFMPAAMLLPNMIQAGNTAIRFPFPGPSECEKNENFYVFHSISD